MSGTVAEEKYFPRGKIVSSGGDRASTKARKAEKRRQNEDLFRVINATKKSKKAKKGSGGNHSKGGDADQDESVDTLVVEPLTQKTIQTGMVILGAVHHIYGSMVRVALPGIVVNLPIGNVSASYSKLAERWAQISAQKTQRRTLADGAMPEKLLTLDELFRVGQIVKVAVQLAAPDRATVVSTIPEDVNGGLKRDQLWEGMVLQAAVSSIEDHGYALEIGVEGGAFLAAKHAPRVLHVGELLLVRVERKGQTGRIKFLPYSFDKVVEKGEEWNLNTILPGMVIEGTIIQKDASGIGLSLLSSDLTGAVEPRQIPREAELSNQLAVQTRVSALVLYKHPILNSMYCSLRVPLIDEANPLADFHGIRLGQVIDKAVVVEVTASFVKLEVPFKKKRVSLMAVATKENVCDDDSKEPPDVFTPGQVAACRVLGLSLLERELYVSLKESVVENGNYFTEEDLVVGKVVPAKVKYTNDTGIVFDICPGVVAFCDYVEASFVANAKNAAELYPRGKPVHVRIRYINGKHYPKRYFVTCNKQLVKSKHEPIASYETRHVGKISDGIVLMVKPRGLLVGFFNKVRGWVPEEYLPQSYARADENFKVGQVVTAKVMNTNADADRMTLSLRVNLAEASSGGMADEDEKATKKAAKKESESSKAKTHGSSKAEPVEMLTDLEARVVKKDRHCLEVEVDDLGSGLLSREQLSDFSDISRALFAALTPGAKLDGLTCYGTAGGKKQLTLKPFVRSMVLSGQVNRKPLKVGSVVPGTIKSAGTWGAVLTLLQGQSAKVMLRDLSDTYVPKDHTCLNEGATLVCKVTSIGAEDDTVSVSCKRAEVNYALDALYKESLVFSLRTLISLGGDDAIGQVVKVVPKKVAFNIICEYKGQRAIACGALTTDGQSVRAEPTNAIILGYRFQDGRKEYVVTVDRDVVYKYLQVARRLQKVKRPPSGKGLLHCKTEVLVLAVLRDYAAAFTKDGRLVMLTLGNHPNDVRRGHWTFDKEGQRLPRVVEAYLYDSLAPVSSTILVGNFCRAEGVASVDTHIVERLGEDVEMIDDFGSADSSSNDQDLVVRGSRPLWQQENGRQAGASRTTGTAAPSRRAGRRRNETSTGDSGESSSSLTSSDEDDEEDGEDLDDDEVDEDFDEDVDENGVAGPGALLLARNGADSGSSKFDSDESGASDSEFDSEDS